MIVRLFPLLLTAFLSGFVFLGPSITQSSTQKQFEFNSNSISVEEIGKAHTYISHILKYSTDDKIPLPLILAIIKAESNFNPQAVSRKGALGLMQLMPETAMDEYNKLNVSTSSLKLNHHLLNSPELNILLGINHLKYVEERFSGIKNPGLKRKLMIAAYNSGLRRVKLAFECRSYSCVVNRVNKYGIRYVNQSIERLPSETRSYVIIVNRSFKYYSELI